MKKSKVIADSEYSRMPSAVAVELGDIIQADLGLRVVTEVNGKNATTIRIAGSDAPRLIELEISKHRIIERRGAAGLAQFLEHKRAVLEEQKRLAPIEQTKAEHPPQPQEQDMSAETKTKRVRKSRAKVKAVEVKTAATKPVKPEAKTIKPEANGTENGHSRGKLGQLFGHSVVRCVAAAGAKGATYEQVVAGLAKHNIVAKEATIKQNLRLGKNGKLAGAELTKEQLSVFGV